MPEQIVPLIHLTSNNFTSVGLCPFYILLDPPSRWWFYSCKLAAPNTRNPYCWSQKSGAQMERSNGIK